MSRTRRTLPHRPRRTARRGIALLLVLVAVVLGLTAASIAAQVAVTAGVTRRLDVASREADDIASSLAPRIERWLVSESARAVAPIDAVVPAIAIADERVEFAPKRPMRVRVTAYDQYGMVPWDEALSGGPMTGAIPGGAVEAVRAAPRGSNESPIQPGLDLLGGTDARGVWPGHVLMRDATGPKRFARDGSPSRTEDIAEDGMDELSGRRALGALLATHASRNGRPSINVNTAPRSLIALAESLTGRSVWSVVEDARSRGKPAPVGSLVAPPSDASPSSGAAVPSGSPSDADRLPTFVASSDVWSFRVDVTVDRARSSWWLTYVRGDRGWTLRQRLRITG